MNHNMNDPKYREQPIFCEKCNQNTIGIVTMNEGTVSVECKNCKHAYTYNTRIVDPQHTSVKTGSPSNIVRRFTQVRTKQSSIDDHRNGPVEEDWEDDDGIGEDADIEDALDTYPVFRCYLSCRHEYISPDARIYTASLSTTLSEQSDIDYFKDIADHGDPMVLIPAELFDILAGRKRSKKDD